MIAVVVLRYMYKKKRTEQNNPAYYDMQLGYANPMFPPNENDGSYESVPGSGN